jgi:hypothetical protein
MYLFTRDVLLAGDVRKTLPLAVGMAELVTRTTEVPVSLWVSVLGAPVGTVSYSAFFQSMSEMDAATTALMADEEYLQRLDEATQHVVGAPEDRLLEILHNAGGEYRRAEAGSVVQVTTAQVSNARFGPALTWSTEAADLVAEITGTPVILGRGVADQFGTLAWISSAPNMAGIDSANEALAKDPRYLTKLDTMGDSFIPGSGRVRFSRRIA